MKTRIFIKQLLKPLKSLFSYFVNPYFMHVRISERGRRLLNNKALANKVVDAIEAHKSELSNGKAVRVGEPGEKVIVRFVTTIKEDNKKK